MLINVTRLHIPDFFQNMFAALETMLIFPSIFKDFSVSPKKGLRNAVRLPSHRQLDEFANEVSDLFSESTTSAHLLAMSERLKVQYREKLRESNCCMLPSFNHTLPSGSEKGTYLAMDVGGSTFRIALVELMGREAGVRVTKMESFPIDEKVKRLPGTQIFDWMAERIEGMLNAEGRKSTALSPIPLGLSWSFPLDQTSLATGRIIAMGKGFVCSQTTEGLDLRDLITEACASRNLHLRVDAIINDGLATLISHAYIDGATRMSLILGTGTNMAVHLPVKALGSTKFGTRPDSWHARASNVIVNTEVSMFGGGILPLTRWDEHLNRTHIMPNYQPLEYLITGRYLGELVRLIILEAVETANLFDGYLPESLREAYSLDTSIVAAIEADVTPHSTKSAAYFQKFHKFITPPSTNDMLFLRRICTDVGARSAAYISTAIHSLWSLRNETATTSEAALDHVSIACDGSVINKYPGFKDRCQTFLRGIIEVEGTVSEKVGAERILLVEAQESALLGAAVAAACVEAGEEVVVEA